MTGGDGNRLCARRSGQRAGCLFSSFPFSGREDASSFSFLIAASRPFSLPRFPERFAPCLRLLPFLVLEISPPSFDPLISFTFFGPPGAKYARLRTFCGFWGRTCHAEAPIWPTPTPMLISGPPMVAGSGSTIIDASGGGPARGAPRHGAGTDKFGQTERCRFAGDRRIAAGRIGTAAPCPGAARAGAAVGETSCARGARMQY